MAKYIGFWVYRRSYLLWPPVLAIPHYRLVHFKLSHELLFFSLRAKVHAAFSPTRRSIKLKPCVCNRDEANEAHGLVVASPLAW